MADPLSARSEPVKAARRLTRRAARSTERRFLAEGPQAVREALESPDNVEAVFATYDASRRHPELIDRCSAAVPWRLADEAALASLSDAVTPQGVVAVCRMREHALAEILAAPPRLLAVCASIRDPGNAGTVIRCADAAGAGAVLFTGDAVDPYNGKAVRASAGSLFHLPVITGLDLAEAVVQLRRAGLQVLAADGSGSITIDEMLDQDLLSTPTAWVFGNEAWGLPGSDLERADRVVRIPIFGRAESLNLATAAAVCLYASARAQR